MASLVAQGVENPPALRKNWVQSLGWEDPLEEGMATHSGILAWKIPRAEEPGGLQSMALQRIRHDWVTKHSMACDRHIMQGIQNLSQLEALGKKNDSKRKLWSKLEANKKECKVTISNSMENPVIFFYYRTLLFTELYAASHNSFIFPMSQNPYKCLWI